MASFYSDMLLFSLERGANSCLLYFVEFDTLSSKHPNIHRFAIRRSWFTSFVAGGMYNIEVRGDFITNYRMRKEFLITDPYYLMLMEYRALRYGQTNEEKCLHPSDIYPFAELRELLAYHEPRLLHASAATIRTIVLALALAIPCALYVLLIYLLIRTAHSFAAIPIIAVCALPLMYFLMTIAYRFTEAKLLKWPLTRYGLLRAFALRTGGYKKQQGMTERKRKNQVQFGVAAALLLGISLLSLLL